MKHILTITLLSLTIASFAQTNIGKSAAKPQPAVQKAPLTTEQEAKNETERMNRIFPLGAMYDKVLAVNTSYFAKKAKIFNDQKRGLELTQEQKGKLRDLNEAHVKELEAAMGKEQYEKFRDAEKAKVKADSEKAKERQEQQKAVPEKK